MTAEPHGFHGYVGVQRRGVIALPVPADQAWFWTERWQQREREVDEHVAAGQVVVREASENFLAHLDDLDADE